MKVLVTGVTGYIGGRLVPRILEQGHSVRVLVRDRFRIHDRPWAEEVEVVEADLLDPPTLEGVFEGIEAAYYLVHSMYAGSDFARTDRVAAGNFCRPAESVRHVIYLGGLVPRRREGRRSVSRHLSSRAEIGRILSSSNPLTEFRAGPIIGSGSASFEIVRYVTERFPVMFAPPWIDNEVQPIAIRDVLSYLTLALDRGPCGVVEIGGESLSYREMMLAYAELRQLRRRVIAVPWLRTGRPAAMTIGLFTPIPGALATPLVEGMAEPLRAQRFRARHLFPEVRPIPYRQAVELALKRVAEGRVETRWSGAMSGSSDREYCDSEGLVQDVRTVSVNAPPETVFRVLSRIGGDRGWPTASWAYRARAVVDRLIGGPGLRRGRRDSEQLLTGEAVDFWRVEAVTPPHLLRLCGQIRFPGHTSLQWEVVDVKGRARVTQTVTFALRGLRETLYWYALYPLHRWFFARTLRAVTKKAVAIEQLESTRGGKIAPPISSRSLLGDVRHFFLNRPGTATLVELRDHSDLENYGTRIMQRIGIDVTAYSILNLHRIGVEAPVQSVFEELLSWDGHSSCWPNNIARVMRRDRKIEHIEIRPLGLVRIPFGGKAGIGWKVPPLFVLDARRIQRSPDRLGSDNARYLLYSCSGGYPIGVFAVYVRSSLPERGETERTQVFFLVGFDFYGKESLSRIHPLSRLWEMVHNRVTANVLNRFKQLCEWRFQRTQAGG